MRKQAGQAFITHVRHELALFFFNACRGEVSVGGFHSGWPCDSCMMPTGSHYTWVLSGSFRAPKNVLRLNGAFGKRGVHWNHKQTQEESEIREEEENERERERERKTGWVGERETTTAMTQEVQRKDRANNRAVSYNMAGHGWERADSLNQNKACEVKQPRH